MIKYPNGKTFSKNRKPVNLSAGSRHILTASNRGMSLENDINISNDFYVEKNIALITKRPTPINVVKVDYSKNGLITRAFFEEKSTTDYNGIYRGKYIDFEAKSTKSKTSIPLSNISPHQIEHLKSVCHHGGIAFFIIDFSSLGETYLLDAHFVIDFYEKPYRKSIPYEEIKTYGHLIRQGIRPRLHYIEIIDKIYF